MGVVNSKDGKPATAAEVAAANAAIRKQLAERAEAMKEQAIGKPGTDRGMSMLEKMQFLNNKLAGAAKQKP